MNVSLKVKIFDQKGTRVLQVSKSTLTIGSATHCDIVFDDPAVNPEHARAWLEGGRIWVQDLGTPSGTALNDIRLPALKPMLVRELDVLRLGDSQSTLGLEAILVRAPVVKAKTGETTGVKETTAVDGKPLSPGELEKRRDEAQRLSRELAELRLQVQMARLEKTAAVDVGHQMENLQDEITHIHNQKEKWDETLRQMEEEKGKIRADVERELVEFKEKAFEEMKKASAEEIHERTRGLQEELNKAQEEVSRLERVLLAKDEEKVKVLNDVKKSSNSEVQERTRGLAEELRKAQEECKRLQESLRAKEAEKESLRKSLENEFSEHKTKALNELKKSSHVEVQDRTRALQEDLRKAREENDKLQATIRAKDAEKETLKKFSNAEADERARVLQETANKAHEENEKLQAALRAKDAEKETFKKIQTAEADDRVRNLQENLRKAREESEKLQAALHTKDVEKETLRKTLEKEHAEALAQRSHGAEADQQNRTLQQEVKKLQDHNKRLEKDIADFRAKSQSAMTDAKRFTAESDSLRKEMEKQISEIRAKSFKELSAHMLAEAQKLERWKQEQAHEFNKTIHSLARQKMRVWTAQGLPQEMVNEWESDINKVFRRVVLNDTNAVITPQRSSAQGSDVEVDEETPKKKSSRKGLKRWRGFAIPSFFAVLVAIGGWFGLSYFKQRGMRSFSSLADNKPPVMRSPTRYEPRQNKKYRGSYTENVLYLENYLGAEENADFRRRWQTELNKVATAEWKIDSFTIAPIIAEEQNLIRDLGQLRSQITTTDREAAGVAQMHDRENRFLHDLEGIFKSHAGVERFLKFKRAFYLRNQAYLSRAN